MGKRIFIVTTVIYLTLGILALDGLCKEEKAGILQRIKSAYNNFRKKKDVPKAEPQPKAALPEANIEKKEMTQDEMAADLKASIEENDNLFDIIPELKAVKDTEGKFYYTFKGVKMEELGKEDLGSLAARVHQTLVKLRTDRIDRQMETVRQVQGIQRIPAPPQIQQLPRTPQPPRTPTQPASPSKVPHAPPAPPSRR